MRCDNCGRDIETGQERCPYCGQTIHYGGNTAFYVKSKRSELQMKDFFSDVFKKHPSGAGVRMFMAGTPETTPSPDRMLQEWNKPWLFVRVIAIGLLFAFLSYFMAAELGHRLGIYLLFSFGALVLPLGILTFYWEISIPRDIPVYRVVFIFLIGGMLSLILALLLPSSDGPAYLAPLTEEPAKVIALAVFVYLMDSRYIFSGMLIGAAVGTGFSAFETIYYVMRSSKIEVLIMRSLLAVGGHIAWAAIEGAALVWVKGEQKHQFRHFTDIRFLRYFMICVGLHFVWNTDFSLLPLPYVGDVKYVLLCAGAIFTVFSLIKKAIAQVMTVPGRSSKVCPMLLCTGGPLAGSSFVLEKRHIIGRDGSYCNIVFPEGTAGVSRRHCAIDVRPNGVYIMDLGSSYGTVFLSGRRVPPNQWMKISEPFYVGSTANLFEIR